MRTSKPGNSVYFQIGIFRGKNNRIEIRSDDKDETGKPYVITAVSDDESKRRGHPDLFKQLARILRENGAPGV